MRHSGILRTWHEGRGFGFIAPSHGGPEIFVHISAFRQDGTHPVEGERLTYEVAPGKNGKPQAVNVVRTAVGLQPAMPKRPPKEPHENASGSWIGNLVALIVLAGAVAYGYKQYTAYGHQRELARMPAVPAKAASSLLLPAPLHPGDETARIPASPAAAVNLRCDGRTMCSQMTSCAEATWFLNNCPGTQMDGNHDGVPCEQQWCTGLR